MSLKDDILDYIRMYPGATDVDLRNYFNKSNQQINNTCHALKNEGFIVRRENPEKNNLKGNYPIENAPAYKSMPGEVFKKPDVSGNHLQEDEIKLVLHDYLTADGWNVEVAWGHKTGVDIDAKKDGKRWLIEVKGPGSRPQMRVNYFIGILGETLQRMDDPDARYSIALPDMPQFRGLWDRLPELAKERTTIDLLLIDPDGNINVLK